MSKIKIYKAEERSGYWVCVDTRSGQLVSYPTTKATAQADACTMNRAYAEAVAA